MKKSAGYLKYTAVLALMATLVALALWITGMYRSSMVNYRQITDKCLMQAADTELNIRRTSRNANYMSWFNPYAKGDTSAFINKTIELEDTIIHVRIRKDDPTALTKLRQFYIQFSIQLNTVDVDNIFKRCMAENYLPVKASYVEYLDLKKNTLITSNAPEGNLSGYMASDIDTLDIMKSIGVRAHTKVPLLVLLDPVIIDLALTVGLMLIVVACIIRLIIDIRELHAKGFRLLRFVSLKAEHSLVEAAGQIGKTAKKLHHKGLEEESAELNKTNDVLLISANYFDRLRDIIDNEEGRIEFHKTVFDVRTLLDELETQYELLTHKDIAINVVADYGIMMYTDRYYLKRVFEEILDNSVKYSPQIVRIQIIIMQQEQEIIMVVCDSGGGIDQSDLDNMFIVNHDIARFFKEELKRETKSGLGFSYVISFVRALGGEVKITSDDGMTGVKMIFTQTRDDFQEIANHGHIMLSGGVQVKTINFTERISPVS